MEFEIVYKIANFFLAKRISLFLSLKLVTIMQSASVKLRVDWLSETPAFLNIPFSQERR